MLQTLIAGVITQVAHGTSASAGKVSDWSRDKTAGSLEAARKTDRWNGVIS